MKRIISILLTLTIIFSSFAFCFAEQLDDSGLTAFAKVEFNGGIAGSYQSLGAILFEKDGQVTILAKGFDYPTGLAVDADGNLYVCDTGSNRICKITKEGKLSTYKTGLNNPTGLTFSGNTLYVCNTGTNEIVKFENGIKSVLCGIQRPYGDGEYEGGFVDGALAVAEFDHPQGIAVAADGTIYVADTNNAAIRKIAGGVVSTVAVNRDGKGEIVKPGTLKLEGSNLYINDLYTEKTITISTAAKVFEDVPENAWYLDDLNKAVEYLLIEGDNDTSFGPNRKISRAEVITIIARTYLRSNANAVLRGDSVFSDVASGAWYADYVNWAASKGITVASSGAINPTSSVTREEVVAMLYNYAKFAGVDLTAKARTLEADAPQSLSDFTDASLVSDEYKDAVDWAVKAGIIDGYPDGSFAPQDSIKRCESIAIFVRFLAL